MTKNEEAHNNFAKKINEYINNNKEKIKEFFKNNSGNDDSLVPIKNRIKEKDFILDIFNFPAFFNMESGILILLTELQYIFKIFFEKHKGLNEEEKKDKYRLFLKSLIEEEVDDILSLTGIKCDDEQMYKIKHSMDLLVQYFDIESIQSYFSKESGYFNEKTVFTFTKVGTPILGSASIIALSTFTSANLPLLGIFGGVGLVFCLGLGIYIYNKYNEYNAYIQNLEEKEAIIKNFFDRINAFYNYKSYMNSNIFLIAIDKTKTNNGDFILQNYTIKGLPSFNSPKIVSNTGDIQVDFYKEYFEGINYFFEKYKKIAEKEKKTAQDIAKIILEDFQNLSKQKTHKDLVNYLNEEKFKDMINLPSAYDKKLSDSLYMQNKKTSKSKKEKVKE